MEFPTRKQTQRSITLIAALFLAGCATGTISMKEENIESKIAGTPYVKNLTAKTFLPRTPVENIQVFYKTWNALTEPNAIVNWKSHFQIAEGSDPKLKYEALAEVTHYQSAPDDAKAVFFLKQLAASQGGDALVDVWKSPAIDSIRLPAKIIGYRYKAIIVRFKQGEPA